MRSGEENKVLVSPFELSEIIYFVYVPKFLDKEFLHDRYVIKKLTSDEIAAEICSSRSTVLKYLQKFWIPTRERHYVKKSAYGQEIKNFEKVDVKVELERIEFMKKLKLNGYSYRQIAEVFNDMGIATKTVCAKWHGKTIYSILKNN